MQAARGADGKTYHVPADMKYPEWKKQFTGGGKPKTEDKLAKSLRADEKFQNRAAQRREEWKKRHASFDKESAKLEINTIRSQVEDIQKQISESSEKGKILEKKVYFDGTGSDEDMAKLKTLVDSRKKSQESLGTLKEKLFAKQEIYKTEAENRIVKAGIVEEIKLSNKMTPETVDALEDTLKRMKDKYEIMPKGIVYNPTKVPDATASYNWLDDKIYISNRFNDIEKYAETVKASEASLKEYREKSKIIDIQKEKLKNAEKILSDKSIKGYEREKAILAKAEAKIELNIQRMAVREDLMDVFTHEYGHFIHRHAETDYIQKSKVFQAKELGGKLINRDWKYDINTRYSAKAKIDAAKIKAGVKNVMAPKMKLEDAKLKRYTENEIKSIAKEADRIAGKYVSRQSKWSGNVVVDDGADVYGKLWNCDIATKSKTSGHIFLHKQLHARSISHYNPIIYAKYQKIEEATVQLLAQEISKAEGIEINESLYDELANNLRRVNEKIHIAESDYDFALQIFRQPVTERLVWLEDKIAEAMRNGGIIDLYQELNELVEQLYGGM